MAKTRSFFTRGRKVLTVDRLVVEHQRAGFALQGADSSDGSEWIVDSVPAVYTVMQGLRERRFFTCLSTFPAVPVNKPSIRFTLSRHNSLEDIRDLVDAVAELSQRRLLLSQVMGRIDAAAVEAL